eukprot:CAMPEP_0197232530 /NCGR_PEP_ID=MMETSP1429-20130617/789_1 /TAXON_ID=49237 /ORGANISM="Chaetoceros  sp., Strain UNC1202" /LENGTH=77 /DNA_ID=CAMNT_0042690581 /DNA_START=226 /DNA_END=459 /DNA_ORIENTATION=+
MALLIKGGEKRRLGSLAISMFSVKVLNGVRDSGEGDVRTSVKAWTSLIFSGSAFCFKLRSMELLGGVMLIYHHLMQL